MRIKADECKKVVNKGLEENGLRGGSQVKPELLYYPITLFRTGRRILRDACDFLKKSGKILRVVVAKQRSYRIDGIPVVQ